MIEEIVWHGLDKNEAIRKLNSSEKGISDDEADLRLKKYGANQIKKIHKVSPLKIFFKQFNSFLIYILIAAAIISLIIGDRIDAVIISVIALFNSSIGFFQEYQAEKAIEKLRDILVPHAKVLRNGKLEVIDSNEIVPGDIMIFDEGDKIMADARLISEIDLEINEAVLTGESISIEKSSSVLNFETPLVGRKNMVYTGTVVTRGNGRAIVISTGMTTEFGKIASLVQEIESPRTPLQERFDVFAKQLGIFILALCFVTSLIGIIYGFDKLKMFILGVSLAVSAIPEGLPAVLAITLALTVQKMSKINALIRKLPAAETLGRTTVICTDKTGTLTEERMSVIELYFGNKILKLYDKDEEELKSKTGEMKDLNMLLKIGILCNNVEKGVKEDSNSKKEIEFLVGDPTEKALVEIAEKFGLEKEKIESEEKMIKEFAFTSTRKMMSIVRESKNGNISYIKGSPETILKKCSRELINGKSVELNEKRKDILIRIYQDMASNALRVLAFAYKEVGLPNQNIAESNLIFAGFQGMMDPPRKEVKDAVKKCQEAGIRIIMITGDSAITAKAVSKNIGLDGSVLSDVEIEKLSDDDLSKAVKENSVFSRVSPKSKLRIVEILRKNKEIVAVTGDGVNDILALKKADIGIAMGIRGTDVARDTADMILMDDNFASIVNAVHEGRHAYDNIKKFSKFMLTVNFSEIGLVIFSLVMKLPLPLLPLQILWMNLVTDSFPSLALGVEPAESDLMKRKPVQKEDIIRKNLRFILVGGFLAFVTETLVFMFTYKSIDYSRTMVLTTAILFEMFFVFSCKSEKDVLEKKFLNNKWLLLAVGLVILMQITVIYSPLNSVFNLVPLSMNDWAVALAVGSVGFITFEGYRLVRNLRKKDQA